MSFTLVDAASVVPQPWRNGGGQTRELLAWPDGAAWQVRISRADIAQDGPFSAFPQVERWFAVLQGAGVVLHFQDGDHTLRAGGDALRFDGAAAPGCNLIDGPTQDLNLMLRRSTGAMLRWQPAQPWAGTFAMRGLYTTGAGRWSAGSSSADLPAHTLLWSTAALPGPWHFELSTATPRASAWWLGCTPTD